MSPIRGLPQTPVDNAVATSRGPGRASGDKSVFGSVMADVAAPAARATVNAATAAIAKARGERSEEPGKSATPLLRARVVSTSDDDTQPAERPVSGEFAKMNDGERKEQRKATTLDGREDDPRPTETGTVAGKVEAAPAPPVPTPQAAASDEPKQEPVRTPRPVAPRSADTETPQVETRAGSLPTQSAIEPAATGDVALRFVAGAAVRAVDAATRQKPAVAEKATAAVRVVTATVVQTETHLAAPTQPALNERGNQVTDANAEDDGAALDPRDARSRSVPAADRDVHADATEKRHLASGARSETGNSSADGQGRATPAPVSANAQASGMTGGAQLATSVSNNVVAALKGAAPAAPTAAMTAPPAGTPPATPVQAMTVRLYLPEHGRIDVRLAARGTEVSLHLTAEREETVRKLAQEKDAVVASLRDAGYDADIRAIATQRAPDTRDAAGAQQQPQFTPNGGAPSGQPGANGSPSESRQSYRDDSDPRPSPRDSHANQSPDDRRAGGIYV